MDKQQELITLKLIVKEFENLFDPFFENKFIGHNVEIKYFDQHDHYLVSISYTTKSNITFCLFECHMFLHPQGSLQFICNVNFKNNNPAPDEKYYNNNFRLKDYTTFRKIPFNEKLTWKQIKSYEEGIEAAKELFVYVKQILLLEEMQKILFTNYWINVPIDYSPYK